MLIQLGRVLEKVLHHGRNSFFELFCYPRQYYRLFRKDVNNYEVKEQQILVYSHEGLDTLS